MRKDRSEAFLFAVNPETSQEIGRRWPLRPGLEDKEYRSFLLSCQREVGEDYVIMDSSKRPEFVAKVKK